MSRRTMIAAAGGALTLASRLGVRAQAADVGLVDFHAHFLPEGYVARATAAGQGPDGMPAWPSWSRSDQLLLMNLFGIDVAVLARTLNDEAASLVARAPERLRFLALLPLPDVTAALAELARALALPGCVGAVVYAGALNLADTQLDPLWKALDDAAAAVLVHPQLPAPGTPDVSLEGASAVARGAMELFEARVGTRFPRARIILAGAGGILPGVLDRIQTFGLAGYTISPDQTKAELAALYFDCAGAVVGTQLPALLKHVPIARVPYGSDSGALLQPALAELASALDGELTAAPGKTLRAHCAENGRTFTLG